MFTCFNVRHCYGIFLIIEMCIRDSGGVGVKGMRTKEEEIIDIILHTSTHTDVLFFTSKGKVYRKRGYQIPQYRREGKGLPVINLLNIEKEEAVRAIVSTDTYGEDHYLLYAVSYTHLLRPQFCPLPAHPFHRNLPFYHYLNRYQLLPYHQ